MITQQRLDELAEADDEQYYGLDTDQARELINGASDLLDQLTNKDKQIVELREALSFYANQENYEIEQGEHYSKMWVDEGFKAQQVLQGGDKSDN